MLDWIGSSIYNSYSASWVVDMRMNLVGTSDANTNTDNPNGCIPFCKLVDLRCYDAGTYFVTTKIGSPNGGCMEFESNKVLIWNLNNFSPTTLNISGTMSLKIA
ncbi:uncharacterized protein [Rutidosis leptorrhynchoides]|uniref:uncharacterized protein n=1 Tax=Rutidosis leptorrhynchoides TaxID=125765 RepID=UPI003A99CB05